MTPTIEEIRDIFERVLTKMDEREKRFDRIDELLAQIEDHLGLNRIEGRLQ